MSNTVEPDWQKRSIQFVYELLSPAILGSMIYDMFRPEDLARLVTLDADNPLWKNGKFLSRFAILCLFCMTWLYHRKSKRRGGMGLCKKVFILVIDVFSAFAFPVAFVFVGDEYNPFATPVSVFVIASLYCIAQRVINKSFCNWGVGIAGLAVLIMAGDIVLHRLVSHNLWCDFIALLSVAFLYLLFLSDDETPVDRPGPPTGDHHTN